MVRLAHSADLRSRLRHVSSAPSIAYSAGCFRVPALRRHCPLCPMQSATSVSKNTAELLWIEKREIPLLVTEQGVFLQLLQRICGWKSFQSVLCIRIFVNTQSILSWNALSFLVMQPGFHHQSPTFYYTRKILRCDTVVVRLSTFEAVARSAWRALPFLISWFMYGHNRFRHSQTYSANTDNN